MGNDGESVSFFDWNIRMLNVTFNSGKECDTNIRYRPTSALVTFTAKWA